MKTFHMLIVAIIVSMSLGISYYFFKVSRVSTTSFQDGSLTIRDFNYDKDHQAVDDLFHKGDNFYWMYMGAAEEYSVDYMLKYKTSSQFSKKHDLILKVGTYEDKVVGFLGYHMMSTRVWKLLFLIVDQDFRRQGFARKLLDFAVHDMVRHGALIINLGTRDNNFKAQSLYEGYGFKIFDTTTPGFLYYSWSSTQL